MEQLPSDVLRQMAFDMSYSDIISLCSTSTKFRNSICESRNFWVNKLIKDFKYTQQSFLKIDNPKEEYENVLKIIKKNRAFCGEFFRDSFYKAFLEEMPEFLLGMNFETSDILVFNYISDKILARDRGLPNYYPATYDRYLAGINPIYQNRIHRGKEFTPKENELLTEIIMRFRDIFAGAGGDKNTFLKYFLDGILRGDIPYDITLKKLCDYDLY